ncbi:MAG: FecR protein [Candidatus Cloacimonetes bacterium ADurb.Bin089]|nr:MAG: FecR protein [Candidatus Cloacimonetes bacterium ADurb.Bin089]
MKKLFLFAIVLILAVNLLALDSVAIISASKGKVDLRRATKVIKHKTGDMLQNNDEIRTGGESFAACNYIDGSSTIKIFSNSVVRIFASTKDKKLSKTVKLNKGSVFSQIKSDTGPFAVQTPTTVASVKGTGFLAKFDEQEQTKFIVTEGELELKILDKIETQSVAAGNTAIIQADGSCEIRPVSEIELEELEQVELQSKQEKENKKMRIPVVDPNGKTRYIEITW